MGLVVTLLMALCLLFGADSGPKDSLLYAKFQVRKACSLSLGIVLLLWLWVGGWVCCGGGCDVCVRVWAFGGWGDVMCWAAVGMCRQRTLDFLWGFFRGLL